MTAPAKVMMPYCYFRKSIVPLEQATVSIASHSLQYGSTCFAGLRGYHKESELRIMRLEEHHARLMNGAKIMGYNYSMSYTEFKKTITSLIEANAPKSDCYFRPFIFSEEPRISPHYVDMPFDLAIYMMPLGHYFDPSKGLRMMISSWRKIPDSVISIKAKAGGCYLNSSLATMEAKNCGYDEALMLDIQGSIAEATVANILISYQGQVYSPSQGSAVLDGITLRTAIQLLEQEGIPVRRETIDRSMLYSSDELILTGTAAQIMHAESIDGRMLGNEKSAGAGPICSLLRCRFQEIIDGTYPYESPAIEKFTIPQPQNIQR